MKFSEEVSQLGTYWQQGIAFALDTSLVLNNCGKVTGYILEEEFETVKPPGVIKELRKYDSSLGQPSRPAEWVQEYGAQINSRTSGTINLGEGNSVSFSQDYQDPCSDGSTYNPEQAGPRNNFSFSNSEGQEATCSDHTWSHTGDLGDFIYSFATGAPVLSDDTRNLHKDLTSIGRSVFTSFHLIAFSPKLGRINQKEALSLYHGFKKNYQRQLLYINQDSFEQAISWEKR